MRFTFAGDKCVVLRPVKNPGKTLNFFSDDYQVLNGTGLFCFSYFECVQ